MSIGQTVAEQIGRHAFVMIGARDILTTERGLQFAVGRNERKVSKIAITLEADDTYTMRFYAGRGLGLREIAAATMVYADSLRPTIEAHTGLYTSL